MHRWLARAATALCILLWSALALAQAFPARPLKLIVPFPAGGPADVLGRLVTQKMAESLGVPVIVENRAGANGIIGTDFVAKSPPDGHIVLVNTGATTINAHVYSKLPYDLLRDLAPVTMIAKPSGLVVVANASLGVSSVQELIALAKKNPGKLTFSSSGQGSALQLAGELFSAIAGIELVHVPYKGAAPALQDLLAGQVQLMFPAPESIMPYVRTGKLRLLAQTGLTREAVLPDVPTLVEEGFGDFNITGWFGIWTTAGTPDPIVRRLHAEIAHALQFPDVRERFAALGATPSGMSPEEFGLFVRDEYTRIGRYVKRAGMRVE